MFADPPPPYGCPLPYNNSSLSYSVLRNFAKPWVAQPQKNCGKFKLRRKTSNILQIAFYYYNECKFEQSFLGILISGTNYTFVILEMIVFLTRIIK